MMNTAGVISGAKSGDTSASKNVVRLGQAGQSSVYNKICTYLNDFKSANTRKSYEKNYKQFFKYMHNKELHELQESDLRFKLDEVMEYRNFLKGLYQNSSINHKIASLKALMDYLRSIELDVWPEAFALKRLDEFDSQTYGVLEWHEVEEMIERVKTHRNGLVKSLLIELAVKTSLRLKALLELKWSNFERVNGVYRIVIVDKGKLNESSVEAEFYERLLQIKQLGAKDTASTANKKDTDRLFTMDVKTCDRMIQRLREEMQIAPERNIVFHSLKKTGVDYVYNITDGDIMATAQQGNHSMYTAMKSYIKKQRDPSKFGSLLVGKEVDLGVLSILSKEELIGLVKSCDKMTQLKIARSAEKLFG